MLNVDESALFDALFTANICPMYYVEVLADLKLENPGKRTCEKVVSDLAAKTPVMRAYPNVIHTSLCLLELFGSPIEMRGAPVLAQGTPVRREGRVGVFYQESAEAKAFGRWQRREFLQLEHEFASQWRAQLKSTDHAALAKLAKSALRINAEPKNLEDAYALAKEVVHGKGQQALTLKTAYALLGLPHEYFAQIQERWKRQYQPVEEYAPYMAHCLLVDVFFHITVDKKLISPSRASNKIDLSYLYYLPFAQIFVSNDKLHRRVSPLFLQPEQLFIGGQELKDDLKALDAYYSKLPGNELAQGLFHVAARPPNDDLFLTTRLWKTLGHPVEPPRASPPEGPLSAYLLDRVRKLEEGAKSGVRETFEPSELRDPHEVSIQRLIPTKRGKWQLLPKDLTASKAE
ncbi:hypothetical protein [Methyloligella sp. GL2]|uniref:hypothetical protein n=2 Tax=unclassified Methyloligella TaxID=2625955 RepID=UPI001ABA35E2|nr:hypothetical protein [Methyloligella sp. GL2]